MQFGEKVRALAFERGMSQMDLVDSSGLSKSHINAIWHDRVNDPRMETMLGLKKAFGMSLDELSDGVEFGNHIEYAVVKLDGTQEE